MIDDKYFVRLELWNGGDGQALLARRHRWSRESPIGLDPSAQTAS